MTQTLFHSIELSRFESLAKSLEIARGQEPVRANDLADLVSACAEIPMQMRRLNDSIVRHVTKTEPGDMLLVNFIDYGNLFKEQFRKEIELAKEVAALVRDARRQAIDLENERPIEPLIEELERLYDEIFKPWPFFTKEAHEEALAEISRGEFVPIEEWEECVNRLTEWFSVSK